MPAFSCEESKNEIAVVKVIGILRLGMDADISQPTLPNYSPALALTS